MKSSFYVLHLMILWVSRETKIEGPIKFSIEVLDRFLRAKDFQRVVEETIKIHLTRKRPLNITHWTILMMNSIRHGIVRKGFR